MIVPTKREIGGLIHRIEALKLETEFGDRFNNVVDAISIDLKMVLDEVAVALHAVATALEQSSD